jgi:enterochelin esterase-like enzyme
VILKLNAGTTTHSMPGRRPRRSRSVSGRRFVPVFAVCVSAVALLAGCAGAGSKGASLGTGRARSVLQPAGFAPVAGAPGGRLLEGVFPGTLRAGFVYLPAGYTPTRRYPVVYLLHGMPGSPSEYTASLELAGWADAAVGAGKVRPFIAVVPAAGPDRHYNGEWAGRWQTALVDRIVPWVDARLATVASPAGRVLAGLSAGGFGAVDIGLHHPGLFGTIESWSGYFTPLHDGPFRQANRQLLAANDPMIIARREAPTLRADGTRFFLSTGPSHSHWIKPAQTLAFTRELRSLGLTARYHSYAGAKGAWRAQFDTGLTWAFRT